MGLTLNMHETVRVSWKIGFDEATIGKMWMQMNHVIIRHWTLYLRMVIPISSLCWS